MQYVNIAVTALLMFGFGFLPPFATLTPVGMRLLGIFLGVIYGYSTCEIVWPSLMAMVAFGISGYTTMNAAIASMLGHPVVFQVLTQYFVAGASWSMASASGSSAGRCPGSCSKESPSSTPGALCSSSCGPA